ncbi:MAG: hypothetical protein COB08_008010 [Rhodobacteraceae bacterium]|nr:hypothetical protein [Paracoccaceae bacterium]
MIFAAALCLGLPALALADGADADCAAVLAAPPFVDMLTRNEGRDFHEIGSVYSGQALVGLECSIDELTSFFEDSGWELTDYVKSTHGWVDGEYIRLPESDRPSRVYFCVKKPQFGGLFPRCVASAQVYLIGSRVSGAAASVSK